MKQEPRKRRTRPSPWGLKLAYWCIVLMHDNPLLPLIKDPRKRLKDAGLALGQTVLEVGCGPGFFTLPASDMVGENGRVYAVDVNPYAVRRVQGKAIRQRKTNIRTLCTNAAHTGLADESVDLAFLFGLRRIAGGEAALLRELHRVLKPGAVVVCGSRQGLGEARMERWKEIGFSPEATVLDLRRFVKTPS